MVMLRFSVSMLVIFGCGVLCAMQLIYLLPTNPQYEAAWWKVFATVVLAVFSAMRAKGELQHNDQRNRAGASDLDL